AQPAVGGDADQVVEYQRQVELHAVPAEGGIEHLVGEARERHREFSRWWGRGPRGLCRGEEEQQERRGRAHHSSTGIVTGSPAGFTDCSTTFATGLRISRLAISAPPRGDRPAHLPARGSVARGWAVGGHRVKSLGRRLRLVRTTVTAHCSVKMSP